MSPAIVRTNIFCPILYPGAESLGYSSVAHGLFPKGGIELVHHFYQQANERLSSELPSDIQQAHLDPLKYIRIKLLFREDQSLTQKLIASIPERKMI